MMRSCLIYNFAQHYRTNVFSVLDKNLNIDFVFGNRYLDVKKMDYSLISNSVKEVKNIYFGPFYWQYGSLSYVFKEYDVYILLGEYLCLSSWLISIIARIRNKKIIFWTHGWYGNEGLLKRFVKKLFFKLGSHIMTYGNYARDLMIKEGFPSNKISVIHNSLAYDKQLELRKSLTKSDIYKTHFGNDNPVLIFIGRLTKVKKLDLLIDAVERLKQKGQFFNLVFVGDGEESSYLKTKVEQLQLNNQTWFYGACYDEKSNAELIYNSDLCVAPGNIGLTAMHSMVFGTPCLTHNDFKWQMPEFEAIHEGITGSFFERENLDSLVEAIQNWFDSNRNDRATVRMACYKEIDEQWTPYFQLAVIKKILNQE